MALNGNLAPLLASAGVWGHRAFQYRNAAARESATPPVLPQDRAFLLQTAGSSILAARARAPLAAIEADWNAVRLLLAALVPESLPIGPRPASRVAVGGNLRGHARELVVAIAVGRRQLPCTVRRNLVDRAEGFHPEGVAFLVVPEKLLEFRQCP